MSDKDPYSVPALVRGLTLLQAFTPQRPEQTMAQLAQTLGITRSAVFRTVHTLVEEGFLLPVRDGNHFRLGPAVLRVSYGYLASRELLEVAQKPLEALRDGQDWSGHLGVLDGRHILYLIRLPASDGLSSLVHVGSRLPATLTAMGRVLLTQKTEPEIRRLLAGQPKSAIEKALAAWQEDRVRPTVIHNGSFESGLCSVAAPIFDMSGDIVAAISATKQTDYVPAAVEREVLATAQMISRAMGWKAPEA
ncbi:IclR family transcriptional regulator [Rhodobacteraceae bacterium N5(2021)]|uniref:IclR family transcriptional regulator n=1 Tax=Gymnodinialimonas phycosphaerae TaxID=2841589 RepID=A0A975TWE1_9RHOB|nr:IclR family transcriptional regulator [Gymnodinialimonas phycosphaerae]MBY4891891.1 IclR family transcriptional regulator [Gymnodinialimonas phycosphaerae]